MSTTGATRPARPQRPPRLQPVTPPAGNRPDVPPPRRRGSSYERILFWSFIASLVVHVVILVFSPAFMRVGEPPGDAAEPDRFAREALRMVVPVTSDEADDPSEGGAASETQPVARTTTRQASPAIVPRARAGTTDEQAVPDAAEPEQAPSGGGLQLGPRDPRLWVTPRETPLPQSDRERYMEHLQARIDALNDSVMSDSERQRRLRDWTFTDSEGRRWGLSPEGLHLGGVTIPPQLVPLPAPTGDNQRLERDREAQRQRDEIQRQEEARERRRREGGGT